MLTAQHSHITGSRSGQRKTPGDWRLKRKEKGRGIEGRRWGRRGTDGRNSGRKGGKKEVGRQSERQTLLV